MQCKSLVFLFCFSFCPSLFTSQTFFRPNTYRHKICFFSGFLSLFKQRKTLCVEGKNVTFRPVSNNSFFFSSCTKPLTFTTTKNGRGMTIFGLEIKYFFLPLFSFFISNLCLPVYIFFFNKRMFFSLICSLFNPLRKVLFLRKREFFFLKPSSTSSAASSTTPTASSSTSTTSSTS